MSYKRESKRRVKALTIMSRAGLNGRLNRETVAVHLQTTVFFFFQNSSLTERVDALYSLCPRVSFQRAAFSAQEGM